MRSFSGSGKPLSCLPQVLEHPTSCRWICRRPSPDYVTPVILFVSLPLSLSYPFSLLFPSTLHGPTASSRRTSSPSTAGRPHRRRQLLRSVVAGGGTALRSLCWLLLHRRRDVSEGAAAVLLALTNLAPSSAGTGARPAPPWAVLGLIEQGCVPILRMAAGRPVAGVPSPPELDDDRAGGMGACLGAESEAAGGGAGADGGGGGSITGLAARAVLEAVVDEACVRRVDRLVHSVSVSGNRELRANVALALGILSVGSGRGEGGGGGGGGKVTLLACCERVCVFVGGYFPRFVVKTLGASCPKVYRSRSYARKQDGRRDDPPSPPPWRAPHAHPPYTASRKTFPPFTLPSPSQTRCYPPPRARALIHLPPQTGVAIICVRRCAPGRPRDAPLSHGPARRGVVLEGGFGAARGGLCPPGLLCRRFRSIRGGIGR